MAQTFSWLGHEASEKLLCEHVCLENEVCIKAAKLAMFEVISHLLPRHGHLVQALPTAICHIIVATDYVVHIGPVIATNVQTEGAEG